MNDLEAVEGVLKQLAARMKCSQAQVAKAIRRLDNERRGHVSATTGRERDREITALVNAGGFTVREFVKRKLLLLNLPDDLKALVRRGALQPTKALILMKLEDQEQREAMTRRVLLERLSVRATLELLGGLVSPATTASDDQEHRWLALEVSRALGARVELEAYRLVIHHDGGEGLTAILERLGVEL